METIRDYQFDFEKEATTMADAFEAAGQSVAYLEVEVGSDSLNPLQVVGDQAALEKNLDEVFLVEAQYYHAYPDGGSHARNFFDADRPFDATVTLVKDDDFFGSLGPDHDPLLRLFTLYHESGHALMPGGPAVDALHPQREAMADAFAALRLIGRFGAEACPILSMISWRRALGAVSGNTSHFTTTVLDRIIADAKDKDFSSLSLEETADLARDYAENWTPDTDMLKGAMPDFVQEHKTRLEGLARTALSSANDLAFYIGAKVFQPFLHPEGIMLESGKQVNLTENTRKGLVHSIGRDMPAGGLSAIFQRAADSDEAPLTETVRVSRPAGQKPFVSKL